MTTPSPSFADTLLAFSPKHELYRVFDDFLTLALCALSRNYKTGLSYDEDLYLATIAPYKDDPLRFTFPDAFALLVIEMGDRMEDPKGWDVLGEFFENHIVTPHAVKHKGQIFTPWNICRMIAEMTNRQTTSDRALDVLDPAAGTGRMHMAASRVLGSQHGYYAVERDTLLAKACALNYFLSNLRGEVMCANALNPDDFRFSYVISRMPPAIRRITEQEKSPLWNRIRGALLAGKLPPGFDENHTNGDGSQLSFF